MSFSPSIVPLTYTNKMTSETPGNFLFLACIIFFIFYICILYINTYYVFIYVCACGVCVKTIQPSCTLLLLLAICRYTLLEFRDNTGPRPNQSEAHESSLGKSALHMTSGHLKWSLNGHIIQSDPVRILPGHLNLNGKLRPPVVILPPRKQACQRSEVTQRTQPAGWSRRLTGSCFHHLSS